MTIVLSFDTETTGLIKNSGLPLDRQPRVIEYYGELLDDKTGQVLEEVQFLAKPGFPLEPIINQITGLYDHDLEDQPDFGANLERVAAQFARAEEFVAHNLAYDLNMIDFEFRRYGRNLLDITGGKIKTCTVQKTEWIKGHRLKLTDLHRHLFGEPFDGAHRAREDVKALSRCFLDLRSRGEI